MMRTAASLVIVGIVTLASGTWADQAAPQGQPTFRAGVELVQVDVSVLDHDRRPVQGLTAADFTVREDGKVRPVVAFSAVDLPAWPATGGAAWTREVAPDATSNAVPREGRLVVILFDRTIQIANMREARRTAEAVVDELGPADLAAVIYTARGVPQNFTGNRQLLRSAIARPFMGLSDVDLQPGPEVERGNPGECRCGVCPLEAMTEVATALRDVPQRRKMLIFLGSRLPVDSPGICGLTVKDARTKLVRAADVANLTIHTVDSSGLETLAATAEQRTPPPPGAAGLNLQRQGELSVYPDRTGGRAVLNANVPATIVPAIFAESRSYYVLAFEPAEPRRDGRFHDIKVEVQRPGVSVHPRKGYYAPAATPRPGATAPAKNGPPASLVAALAGLWPRTEVPLSVTVAPFAGPGTAEAAVAVVTSAHEPLSADGRPLDGPAGAQRVNVLAGAYDRAGKSVDFNVQSIEVTPPARARQAVDYEVVSLLRLKPGRHEIRVATENATRGTSGSVYTYVEVPDFAKAPLSLSGVVLGATASARKPAGPLGDVLPFTPLGRREFTRADRVSAFVQVYQGGTGTAAAAVSLTTRILDAQNRAMFEQRTPAFENAGRAPRYTDHQVELPLAQLEPGEYLLKIEAGGQKPTVSRDIRFTVR